MGGGSISRQCRWTVCTRGEQSHLKHASVRLALVPLFLWRGPPPHTASAPTATPKPARCEKREKRALLAGCVKPGHPPEAVLLVQDGRVWLWPHGGWLPEPALEDARTHGQRVLGGLRPHNLACPSWTRGRLADGNREATLAGASWRKRRRITTLPTVLVLPEARQCRASCGGGPNRGRMVGVRVCA